VTKSIRIHPLFSENEIPALALLHFGIIHQRFLLYQSPAAFQASGMRPKQYSWTIEQLLFQLVK
jgi:hypothetical protein